MSPRPLTGQVIEKPNQARGGTSYAVRIRVHGRRRYFTVGYTDDGWTRRRAEAVARRLADDIRQGRWTEPATPAPDARQRRERPDAATAYAHVRKAAEALDHLRETTPSAPVRLAARDGLAALYRAEDAIGRALRQG